MKSFYHDKKRFSRMKVLIFQIISKVQAFPPVAVAGVPFSEGELHFFDQSARNPGSTEVAMIVGQHFTEIFRLIGEI